MSAIDNKLNVHITESDSKFENIYSKSEVDSVIKTETNRATTSEEEVKALIQSEENRAVKKENEIEKSVVNLSEKVDSEIDKVKQLDSDITALNNEFSDSINKLNGDVKANTDVIAVLNGGEEVIGSITHKLSDVKHYTDDKVNELSTEITKSLSETLDSYATKTNVDERIKSVIGTAPEALDTLGEIATALENNGDTIAAINGILTGKANISDVYAKKEVDNKIDSLSKDVNSKIGNEIDKLNIVDSDLQETISNETTRAKTEEVRIEDKINKCSENILAEVERAKQSETKINASITSEIARSTAADNKLTTDLQTEVDRATAKETILTNSIEAVQTNLNLYNQTLTAEINRAVAADQTNTDAIAELKLSKADKSEIPTKTSELMNDSGFISEHQSLEDYATIDYVEGKTTELTETILTNEEVATKAIAAMANAVGIVKEDGEIGYNSEKYDTIVDAIDVLTDKTDETNNTIEQLVEELGTVVETIWSSLQSKANNDRFWVGTEAEFNALTTKDSSKFYFIMDV